jgi:hypothetical protein
VPLTAGKLSMLCEPGGSTSETATFLSLGVSKESKFSITPSWAPFKKSNPQAQFHVSGAWKQKPSSWLDHFTINVVELLMEPMRPFPFSA